MDTSVRDRRCEGRILAIFMNGRRLRKRVEPGGSLALKARNHERLAAAEKG